MSFDANPLVPEHAWTGAQLSGTCNTRTLHQLLKVKGNSLRDYQRFILGFKQHALEEYEDLCNRGLEPFNDDVADRIDEGLQNNLKILNLPGLFSFEEKQPYFKKLIEIKERVAKHRSNLSPPPQFAQQQAPDLSLKKNVMPAYKAPTLSNPDTHSVCVEVKFEGTTKLLKNLTDTLGQLSLLRK